MKYDIFISYRRYDRNGQVSGRDIARAIKAELDKRFTVFMDNSGIKDDKYEDVIFDAINSSKIFILLLSRDALVDCAKTGDWVTKELRAALSNNCKIIPVCPDNAFKRWPADFPKDLSSIKDIQISEVSMGQLFDKSIEKLVEDRIDPVIWRVSMAPVRENLDLDGEKMTKRVKEVFSPDLKVGIRQYQTIFKFFCEGEYLAKLADMTSALNMLNRIDEVDYKETRNTFFSNLDREFRKELSQTKRKNMEQLLYYLGDMLVFFHLRQQKFLESLRKSVSDICYHESFWQKNQGDIMEYGGVVAGIAISILSLGLIKPHIIKAGYDGVRFTSHEMKEITMNKKKFFGILQSCITAVRFGE